MRVLIGCEQSATVRDAFRVLGHDAHSCDVLPTEGDPRWHYQCDVREVLNDGWDLAIFHPPCTYLCNSGVKHLYHGMHKEGGINADRWGRMCEAADFFADLYNCDIPRIAVENPIMHGWGAARLGELLRGRPTRKGRSYPDQIVQPHQFGHGEVKATALYLKNLPLLKLTEMVEGRVARIHRMPPGPDRGKQRSVTYSGIARAMAEQWGSLMLAEGAAA